MKKLLAMGMLLASMVLSSCGALGGGNNLQAGTDLSGNSVISVTIDAGTESKGITVTSNKVVKVTIQLTDPTGNTVVTNWVPGNNPVFTFSDRKFGVNNLTITETDDTGFAKTYGKDISILKGYNYKVLVTIGGDLQIVVDDGTYAGGTNYSASCLNIAPGTSGSQFNFSWLTPNNGGVVVQIATASAKVGDVFPVAQSWIFTGSQSVVTGTTNGNANFPTGEFANKAVVTGLADSTSYIYRIGDGTNWSQIYSLNTRNQNNYGFLAAGDPQIGASGNNALDTVNWANSVSVATGMFPSASFMLSVGDQVNDESLITNQKVQYPGYFGPSQLLSLPVAAVDGNHDFSMGEYYGFHYNQPNVSSTLGNVYGNDGDYWFAYGNTLYIVLNSNVEGAASHQLFITAAIAANPNAKWRIVSFHHSLYSEASHMSDSDIIDRRATYPPVFEANNIDVVISGHDHAYTRTYQMLGGLPTSLSNNSVVSNPTGILYMTLNSGSGSKYYQFKAATNSVYSAFRWQGNVPSFSYVTINGGTFTISTYRVDTLALIDQYSIVKTH
jgi:predicted phosphodiesterase